MGKMTGSLSRAGKVRMATPKVDKKVVQKKKKVGRAKRRRQWNKYQNIIQRKIKIFKIMNESIAHKKSEKQVKVTSENNFGFY